MNEATLKSAVCRKLRAALPDFVIERHEDKMTHGYPDLSVTGNKKCTRWEFKFANPDFESKGIQTHTMVRLARAGYAWYIVYVNDKHGQRVFIVEPKDIRKPISEWRGHIPTAEGFNHDWVIEKIKEEHDYK